MKEITYITHNLSVGGSQKVIINLSNEALKLGYRVNLIILVNDKYLLDNIVSSKNLYIYTCIKGKSSKGIAIRILIGINFLKIIRVLKPEFIHSHLWQIDIFYLFLLKIFFKTRIIHTVHSPGGAYLKENIGHRINILIERLVVHSFKNNLVIAVSEETRCAVEAVLKYKKCYVIPNGIDFASFQLTYESIYDPLFSKDKTFFVYPARYEVSKGHLFLLNAFSSLVKTHKNIYLLLVGIDLKENLYEAVKNLKLLDRVVFYGPTAEINRLLKQCHYGVFPSQYEGQGLALCEMMAAGLPVIASDITAVVNVTNNGDGALLFKHDSPADLFLKMQLLLGDPHYAQELKNRGMKIIKDNFSSRKMFESHDLLYEKV